MGWGGLQEALLDDVLIIEHVINYCTWGSFSLLGMLGFFCRGGIGYLILFEMPWVPDGRAGHAGVNLGEAGCVNTCKHHQN